MEDQQLMVISEEQETTGPHFNVSEKKKMVNFWDSLTAICITAIVPEDRFDFEKQYYFL